MSALTDLFTAMANKIRTKTGTQTTYTPSEMVSDGIDDVYDAGVASATTPITPSNASPASMTSGTGYKPTANGYAVESYRNINPANVPQNIFEGEILKVINSDAIVIDSLSKYSPSNASPAFLSHGLCYRTTTGKDGYAIESYDSVTPSSTPASVASGDIVKIGGSGVIVDAIPTPTSITPSDSNPVALTADTPVNPTTNGYAIETNPNTHQITPTANGVSFTSGIKKMLAGGYAYSQKPSIFALLKDLPSSAKTTASNVTNISVTSGKHYLLAVCGIFPSATPTTSITGGTVEWEMPLVNTQVSNSRYSLMKVYLLTATTSSLQVNFGSGTNGRGYSALQLD